MNKEITIIKTKASQALQISKEIVISDNDTLSHAIDILKRIKETGKMIKKQKELIIKPLNEGLKNARDMFRPIENDYNTAEKNIKDKILTWTNEQERIRKEKERKIVERVEKGTLKVETAVNKIEAIPKIVNQGAIGKVSSRVMKKVVIKNEDKLPRKYLMPDMAKIKKDALNGIEIDGVIVVEEKVLASL